MYWRIIHGLYYIFIVVSKYSTTRVLFASTYTAKQLKTIYYSPINNIYFLVLKLIYLLSNRPKHFCSLITFDYITNGKLVPVFTILAECELGIQYFILNPTSNCHCLSELIVLKAICLCSQEFDTLWKISHAFL